MVMYFELISTLVFVILGLASLFFGIRVSMKCNGKLKLVVMLLSASLIVLMIHEIINGLSLTGSVIGINFPTNLKLGIINGIGHIMISILAFLAFLNLDNIIKKIKK